MYHLSVNPEPTDLAVVRGIVLDALRPYSARVFLFGSQAVGTSRRHSDIDVAVLSDTNLPTGVLSEIRERLEDSLVPMEVDLINLAETDEPFRQRVIREGIAWND